MDEAHIKGISLSFLPIAGFEIVVVVLLVKMESYKRPKSVNLTQHVHEDLQ